MEAKHKKAFDSKSVIKGWYQAILRQAEASSIIAFITGLLVHLYIFVNKYPNHDDLTGKFVNFDQAWAGRWLIKYLMPINTSISHPWVNGVFSILMVAPYQAAWTFAYSYATISLIHDRRKGLSLRRGA